MAAEAQECNSLAHDVSEVWNLGRPPDSLVGHPARVTVVFAPEAIDSDGVGGATLGGGVFLSIAGSQEWALGLFECSAGTCHPESPPVQDGRVVLDGTVEMLPAHVEAEYRAEAFVKGGTGRASVSLSGRLESVTFGAVDGGQNGP